ncbi:MAG: hypothetical protein AAFV19_13535 [Pseudomonadota bacterium]
MPAERSPTPTPDLDIWETSLLDAASADIAAAKTVAGCAPEAVAVVPSPHQCRPLVPNAGPAIERLSLYLDVIIEQAFREDPGPQPPRVEDDQSALMDAACRLCRGQCCLSGYDAHAHLGVEDIRRYRRRKPDATPEEIKARYLTFLPEHRTGGGCYFQGEMGCTLPRPLRSELCNTFVCRAQSLLARAEADGAEAMVIVGAIKSWPAAIALWDETDGYRQITPSPAPCAPGDP